MKNRKSLKCLLAPALCAALIMAGMGIMVPAQSLEEEEAAGQILESEESAGQAAGAGDLITDDEFGQEDGLQDAGPSQNADAPEDQDQDQDGENLDNNAGIQEDIPSEGEDASPGRIKSGDGSLSGDEDDPQAGQQPGTEGSEDGIEEDSDTPETSDSSGPSQTAAGSGEEIVTDTDLEEGASATDSGEAESAADGAAAEDPVSAGILRPARLSYSGQAQALVLLSDPAEGGRTALSPTESGLEESAPAEGGPTGSSPADNASTEAGGSAASTKLLYSLDGENYGDAVPTGTDAGQYTVFYRLMSEDGLTVLHAGSLTVTIEKADVVFTPPMANT